MPTYQYACTECDHRFEQVQRFSDDALSECPRCHGRLRKLFNAVGVVFKGSGFYRNDSRGDAAGAPSEKTEAADKAPAGDKASGGDKAGTAEKPASGEKSAAGTSSTGSASTSGSGTSSGSGSSNGSSSRSSSSATKTG